MSVSLLVPFVVPIACQQSAFGQSVEVAMWGREWVAHVPTVVWREGGRGGDVPSFPGRHNWAAPPENRWDSHVRFRSDLAYANRHDPEKHAFHVAVLHAVELELVGDIGADDGAVLEENAIRRPDQPDRFVDSAGVVFMAVDHDSPSSARTRLAERVLLNVDEWRESVRSWVGCISFQWTGLDRRDNAAGHASDRKIDRWVAGGAARR